jgi:hypothetical protein
LDEGATGENGFDRRGLLSALHRNYVSYVLIGGLARVIRGVDEVASGVDVCPSLWSENVEQPGKALEELEARRVDRRRLVVEEEALRAEPVLRASTCRLAVYVRTTTIRVAAETRDRLNALAKRRGAPAGEIVAELVREADDRALLADAEQGWSQLAADSALLAAYRAEAGELEAFEASAPAY